jgi:hypothetical protein
MAHVTELIEYVHAHPGVGIAGGVVVALLLYLINRKPKLAREADERIEQLRRKRGDHYLKLRRLK